MENGHEDFVDDGFTIHDIPEVKGRRRSFHKRLAPTEDAVSKPNGIRA